MFICDVQDLIADKMASERSFQTETREQAGVLSPAEGKINVNYVFIQFSIEKKSSSFDESDVKEVKPLLPSLDSVSTRNGCPQGAGELLTEVFFL